jgi:hypothetical protein
MATMPFDLTAATVAEPAAVLTLKDVACILSLSIDTLKAMQLSHDGPACTQLADGRIRYSMTDVLKFQAQRSAAHKRMMDSFSGGLPW